MSSAAKQKVVQSIKDATNILVAVSDSPSADELSAALGLTVFLNKLGKHATAVFSGDVPPAITFLEPDKTFEQTADSLRDFIIAIDKEKADHLRYKVVDDAVKIFITPYRTTISDKDLEFSQGDYNVELVLALNVTDGDHLDKALTAHGKILHDATVVTIGAAKSSLGAIDWNDTNASGVSEMMVELIDSLKTPKVTLDEQMATALLTGIVAATDRFSNQATSSKTMTAAAELMAAGANQQLVVSQVADNQDKPIKQVSSDDEEAEAAIDVAEEKIDIRKSREQEDSTQDAGALSISHEKQGTLEEVARKTAQEQQEESARAAQAQLDKIISNTKVSEQTQIDKPTFGATLNATTEQAAIDKSKELLSDQNKTILSHRRYVGSSQPSFGDNPLNAAMGKTEEQAMVDPLSGQNDAGSSEESVASQSVNPPITLQPLPPVAEEPQQPQPAADEVQPPADNGSAMPSSPSAEPSAPSAMPSSPPASPTLAEIESQVAHGLPPMPDFSTLPPIPTGVTVDSLPPLPSTQPASSTEFDPARFQIPGQNT